MPFLTECTHDACYRPTAAQTAKTGGNMKVVLGIAAAAAALSGCATITRGSHQAFTVESTPAGAQVTTSLGLSCNATPCTFPRVERDSEFSVTVSKQGYQTWTGAVTHQTAGAGAAGMAGNILLGGIIGAAVDANSGAMRDLVPNPLRVTLEPIAVAAAAPERVAAAEPVAAAPAAPAAAPATAAPATPPTTP